MQEFPIFLRLDGKSALLAGGGSAAAAKLRLLLAAGARVTIVAPHLDPEMAEIRKRKDCHWISRDFTAADLAGHHLVVGATADAARDHAVAKAAREAGLWVNIVDRPELSDFLMPAIVDRGEIVVAVSTGGASPVLAQRVRAAIEDVLPLRLGELAAFARRFRLAVQRRIADLAMRRHFWNEILSGPIADLVLKGESAAAARDLVRRLNGDLPMPTTDLRPIEIASADPDTLTLGELRALREAALIVYEAAIPDSILDLARRDAQRLDLIAAGQADFTGRRVVKLIATAGLRSNARRVAS